MTDERQSDKMTAPESVDKDSRTYLTREQIEFAKTLDVDVLLAAAAFKLGLTERDLQPNAAPQGTPAQASGFVRGQSNSTPAVAAPNRSTPVQPARASFLVQVLPLSPQPPTVTTSTHCPCGFHWEFCTRGVGCERCPK